MKKSMILLLVLMIMFSCGESSSSTDRVLPPIVIHPDNPETPFEESEGSSLALYSMKSIEPNSVDSGALNGSPFASVNPYQGTTRSNYTNYYGDSFSPVGPPGSESNMPPSYLDLSGAVAEYNKSGERLNYSIIVDEQEPRKILNLNRRDFNVIHENPFQNPLANPLSTFSIDVDTAAMSTVRNYINNEELPPMDAVRIEELINYFSYDYPEPSAPNHPFTVSTELATAPWNPEHKLLLLGLQGKSMPVTEKPDSNLVFLLDVSGSMGEQKKLPLVKRAFKMLTDNLTKNDSVAIVVYAGASGLVLPATKGSDKQKIIDALENLKSGGSTAGADGIELAYKIAQENFIQGGNNRVILATDGDFNVGISQQGELERFISEKRNNGIYLSVLGFGSDHYKDNTMELLADKGNGNYAFIDSIREAEKVLISEMSGTLFTIAKDVKIQIEFNPNYVKSYRLIGYENRTMAAMDFADDTKDAGELGAGHSVTALYEIIPVDSSESGAPLPELRFQTHSVDNSSKAAMSEMAFIKLRFKLPDQETSTLISQSVKLDTKQLTEASDNFLFASAVAEYGLILRDSEYKGEADLENVILQLEKSMGEDLKGYRQEFLSIVKSTQLLSETE